jgi:hypothetical protein
MTEFVREVEEEYRKARVAALWRRFGPLAIVLFVLVLAGVGVWQFLEFRAAQRAEASALGFERALSALDAGEPDAIAGLKPIAEDAGNAYAPLARMRLAAETGKTDRAAGAAAFDAIAADEAVEANLRDVARLRAALLLADQATLDEMLARIGRFADPASPWRAAAREILGLTAYRVGDVDRAAGWFQDIALDADAPAGLRRRAETLAEIVRGAGGLAPSREASPSPAPQMPVPQSPAPAPAAPAAAPAGN